MTRPGPSSAGAGGEPRVAGGHSSVVPVRLPCGGRRRRFSLGTGPLGVLTAFWVGAELDERMRLNNWSIAGAMAIREVAVTARKYCAATGSAWRADTGPAALRRGVAGFPQRPSR